MQSKAQDKYYCPMKCEGDKVYDRPGSCPVCNMKLISVSSEGSEHGRHHHAEHEHEHHHHKKHKHEQ
ncbi:MAG: hypothetical protein KJ615_02765, partial [Bacteroidetes bacterium]|nr:hypothetical protein [Bacteroidota bacterium]